MTIDTARAESAYRREVLTRSYGTRRHSARGSRWNLTWVRHLQPRLHAHASQS